MNVSDLTPEQDAAFVLLKKLQNRDNPTNQLTKAQIVQAYITQALDAAVREADDRITGTELRTSYKAATADVKTQVNTPLNL